MSELKRDLGHVKEDASNLSRNIGETAQDGMDALAAGANKAVDTGKKAVDVAKEGHEKMCEFVSANPTSSVLLAAGVGAVLARILWRR